MSLISLASFESVWRGYEYYRDYHVIHAAQTEDDSFSGTVSGHGQSYQVYVNTAHPRKSHCNCPHAAGRRTICKHMVALYFCVFPDEAENYYDQVIAAEEEAERLQEETEKALIRHVRSMTKPELEQALLQLLLEGPEWQYDRFLRENVDEYLE